MRHKKRRSVEEINREISRKLLDSFHILEILEDITEGEAKEDLLIRAVKDNVWKSFKDVERCRTMISVVD